ncbi:MAG: hypothetical protein MJZ34_11260 [Paludibacteraceae bacterium]|nr:hypothetical protein [Paludibacteraceae bacterium]
MKKVLLTESEYRKVCEILNEASLKKTNKKFTDMGDLDFGELPKNIRWDGCHLNNEDEVIDALSDEYGFLISTSTVKFEGDTCFITDIVWDEE